MVVAPLRRLCLLASHGAVGRRPAVSAVDELSVVLRAVRGQGGGVTLLPPHEAELVEFPLDDFMELSRRLCRCEALCHCEVEDLLDQGPRALRARLVEVRGEGSRVRVGKGTRGRR